MEGIELNGERHNVKFHVSTWDMGHVTFDTSLKVQPELCLELPVQG